MPELSPESLRSICDDSCLEFETTADLSPLQAIIGQQRAVQALEFGLDIEEKGFNIYAAGPLGTGKTTAITAFLQELAKSKEPPPDWCYVQNFRDPSQPRALQLPTGRGRDLQRDMRNLVHEAARVITRSFESEDYSQRREDMTQNFRREREHLFSTLNDRARDEGFLLQTTSAGLALIPHKDGKPMTEEEMAAIPTAEREKLTQLREGLESDLKQVFNQVRNGERLVYERIRQMDQEIVRFALDFLIQELREKYDLISQVGVYLDEVESDMAENVDLFRTKPSEEQTSIPVAPPADPNYTMRRYEVNVIVDNSEIQGVPVVVEVNPTHTNLLGHMDKEAQFGALQTDFTMIRPGALHRANGGYLIIRIEEILRNALAWEGLKRSLKEQKIIIEELAERMGFLTTKGLTPEPISLDVKAILIGNAMLYHTLYMHDPDFVELFKVKAEFDSTMERTEENIKNYAAFVCALCNKENLLQMDKWGVTKLVEHSSRLAEDQTKLSTRFAEISDIIREASYWAKKNGASCINADHVNRAIEEKVHRSDLIRDKIVEMIQRGTIDIDTVGEAVGQINGLAVIGLGDFAFGRPGRITVSVGAGREGLIDIERESELGGRLHTKGVLILGGYLADKLAGDIPMSLVARLTFEQSYEEIDGDSASSAELYAILSHLADLPIKQGIAVTGSVNQKGQVQPIGGVNHKIEGFFNVCQAKGLTGEQGVMIPASNVEHLMLREEVVEAVQQGQFHIYSASTIDEGIEILTSVKAGSLQPDGSFEEGSVNQRVSQRLHDMAGSLRNFMRSHSEEEQEETSQNQSPKPPDSD
ncbi:MAG: AAA family ATPase [Dehalococcoidia bacterium]|nr:AAA family ATPase [Dehalococcoidia bacterium]